MPKTPTGTSHRAAIAVGTAAPPTMTSTFTPRTRYVITPTLTSKVTLQSISEAIRIPLDRLDQSNGILFGRPAMAWAQ
ncbi:hypothetical protein [Streptomyces sp. NPDC002088]|uniref:hypothetical protein n=1 Tax=Streptomyces sp. NPDC002088 TaxID=3154665 RepID=UPI00331AEBEE